MMPHHFARTEPGWDEQKLIETVPPVMLADISKDTEVVLNGFCVGLGRGGEGVPWIGQSPFTETEHVFVNLGDGTYFHSGVLAVRACIAAKVNITFKILYNDAVAMTGGQPVDGSLSVPDIAKQVRAEGAKTVVVVADDPDRWLGNREQFPAGVSFEPRDDLDAVQRNLREHKGVSILIYDQTCAAEKRRRRKRGLMEDPAKRAFINQQVCEGCGDCGVQSNCLSILPSETEFGRKRIIDQSSCNKDYSCVKGFCPSFVTVHGGTLRKPKGAAADPKFDQLPLPELPRVDGAYDILVTGVGGTGVITRQGCDGSGPDRSGTKRGCSDQPCPYRRRAG